METLSFKDKSFKIMNGQIQIITDKEGLSQYISQAIYTNRGEWALDISFGVDHSIIESSYRNNSIIDQEIKTVVGSLEEVDKINSYDSKLDLENRKYSINMKLASVFGEVEVVI